jgi:hypothetical protein
MGVNYGHWKIWLLKMFALHGTKVFAEYGTCPTPYTVITNI